MRQIIDQLSTAALRLVSQAEMRPAGSVITSTDFDAMRELSEEGLAFPPEPHVQGYTATLTDLGERALQVLHPNLTLPETD